MAARRGREERVSGAGEAPSAEATTEGVRARRERATVGHHGLRRGGSRTRDRLLHDVRRSASCPSWNGPGTPTRRARSSSATTRPPSWGLRSSIFLIVRLCLGDQELSGHRIKQVTVAFWIAGAKPEEVDETPSAHEILTCGPRTGSGQVTATSKRAGDAYACRSLNAPKGLEFSSTLPWLAPCRGRQGGQWRTLIRIVTPVRSLS
jgi:hypothetical protein